MTKGPLDIDDFFPRMVEKSGDINYETVYKLRRYQTDCLANLKVRYRCEADEKAERDFAKYTKAIKRVLGHDNFEVTNVACMADSILDHVYAPADVPCGVGRKKCIFCGCDDFDF